MTKKYNIKYGNKTIAFKIERSNRKKTVGIHIDPGRGVVVRSPKFLSVNEIEGIVKRRARWIIGKQEVVKNHSQLNPTRKFINGEAFPYLGRHYRLKIIKSASIKEKPCKLIKGRLMIEINGQLNGERIKKRVRDALINWYLERASKRLPQRVKFYARHIGIMPKRIEIKSHKSQWGSCSYDGVIRFNWKIIMTPVPVVDYVVVHELCHLIYRNHSPLFRQKVQTIIPDYLKRRNSLKEYSPRTGIF